jgi:hypothetical protein
LSKPGIESKKAVAAGTNGAENPEKNLAFYLARKCGKQDISADFDGLKSSKVEETQTDQKSAYLD